MVRGQRLCTNLLMFLIGGKEDKKRERGFRKKCQRSNQEDVVMKHFKRVVQDTMGNETPTSGLEGEPKVLEGT